MNYLSQIDALIISLRSLPILRSLKINKEQNKIISLQKDIVEEKQKEILDSIRYAKRIQNSLLPSEKYIEKNILKLKKGQ